MGNKSINRLISLLCVVILFGVTALNYFDTDASANTSISFYVSPDGNDNNSGTQQDPFGTLEGARNAIRALKSTSSLPAGGVTVYLREGTYNRDSSFELTAEDSGTEDSPITYKAYNGEDVKIMGGHDIDTSAFTEVTDQTILDRLPSESRDKVLQVDLSSLGITEYGEITKAGFGWEKLPPAPELFVDNKTMTLARYPNEGYMSTGSISTQGFIPRNHVDDKPTDPGYVAPENYINQQGPIFSYSDTRFSRWSDEDEIWLFGYWKWDWADDNLKVKNLNTSTKRIEAEHPSFYGIESNKRFYAYNLLSEMDMPGEWYLDRTNGKMYIYPEGNILESKVQLSILDTPLFKLDGASYINIEGFTFELSRSDGVMMLNASDNLVASCTFRRLGQRAVVIGNPGGLHHADIDPATVPEGGTNNGIVGCEIYETGAGGVFVAGGDRVTLTAGNNYVENNHFNDFARIIRTYTPAITLKGVANRASHNLIHNAPHFAIDFYGNDHVIENNELYNVVYETSDAGAIYTGRDWTYRGNIIRDNYIHNIPSIGGLGSHGIYLDDAMSSAEITGNVFYDISSKAFLIGGGRDNIVDNNIMIDCGQSVFIDDRLLNWASAAAQAPDGTNYKRLMNMPYQQEPWSSKYPKLVDIWSDNAAYPKGNVVTDNVIYKSGSMSIVSKASQYGTINNNITFSSSDNPGFVDENSNNFNLRSDSAIYDQLPDFQPIDFDNMGLKVDAYRTELNSAIGEFESVSPANNDNVDSTSAELVWTTSEGADYYIVTVAKDSSFDNIVIDSRVENTSKTIGGLDSDTTYYWKVEAGSDAYCLRDEKKVNSNGVSQFTTGESSGVTYLSDMNYSSWSGYQEPLKDLDRDGDSLNINGKTYSKGLGTHANSTIIYDLNGDYTRFLSDIGVDDDVNDKGTIIFKVYTDGILKYDSGLMTGADEAKSISIDVTGCNELKLEVTDSGDNIDYDHANWAHARLEGQNSNSGQPILIEAEDYTNMSGIINGGNKIGGCDNGDWVSYSNIDLGTGYSTMTARVGVPDSYAGSRAEVRLDSTTGTLVGTFTIEATGAFDSFQEQSINLSDANGIHDIYIVFNDHYGVGDFDWFKFSN
ncbi:hypothetical protein SH1V18_04890 [Vallitalea longa]|uniref:CBM6 domain-containing protein n=1 Tax=Vallitalea longa TaxID=2936439 RepID=A0A9W6DEW3_9FIRM|nr:NPCBM/NEW2 domain-containing protein [Vallitalea longa]GKX28009.1 hypothetical protein SH1V18_04890 [Vallitalea longa]